MAGRTHRTGGGRYLAMVIGMPIRLTSVTVTWNSS